MIPTWCLTLPALAAPADSAPPVDFDSAMDQARFLLGRERYADAQEQLELAVGTSVGARDAETWFLLAKVRYEQGNVDDAADAADHARRYSRDPSEFSQTQELYAFFQERFGTLVVDGARGSRASVELEPTSVQLDPELKAYVQKWRSRLASDPITLPFTLGVPVGDYTVNGKAVTIAPGELVAVGARGGAGGGGGPSVDVAVGGGGWSADAGLRTSGEAELALTLPLGGWIMGAVGRAVAQRFGDDELSTGFGGSVGLRGGREVRIGHPWVLVPAIDLRMGRVPGVLVGCGAGSCAQGADSAIQGRAAATAMFVGSGITASYRRTPHLSVGFTIAGERAFGLLPAEVATNAGPLAIGQRGFGAWAWRLQTSVGYRL